MATQKLYILGNGHFRVVDYSVTPAAVSTIARSVSTSNLGFSINRNGDKLGVVTGCGPRNYVASLDVNNALNTYINYVTGACSGAVGEHPTTSGTAASGGFLPGTSMAFQSPLLHSNGNAYFYAENSGNNDGFVYSSDGTTIDIVAGVAGAGGYDVGDEGASALGAKLEKVYHLQEDGNGDILLIGNNRLRKITLSTEPGDPKISTIVDYTAISGFTPNLNIREAIYDEASGWTYFAPTNRTVFKAKPGESVTTYDFSGTSFSGNIRLALVPEGLLVLQPSRSRVLIVAP